MDEDPAREHLRRWRLRQDVGPTRSGMAARVLPVFREDGTSAALRFQDPDPEVDLAIAGLHAWNGEGIVHLLEADGPGGAMLLERLDADRSLLDASPELGDEAATDILAGLLQRLHAAPPAPGLPQLRDVSAAMLEQVPHRLPELDDAFERSMLQRWADALTDVATEPGTAMLHWDLHHGNVLAGEREPWLAIDPVPLVGDPCFDLWPVLDGIWGDTGADAGTPDQVRRRFDQLTSSLSLDRDRARAWTEARLLQNTLWHVEDGFSRIEPHQLLVAEAISPR